MAKIVDFDQDESGDQLVAAPKSECGCLLSGLQHHFSASVAGFASGILGAPTTAVKSIVPAASPGWLSNFD